MGRETQSAPGTATLLHALAEILPAQGRWTEADYLWLTSHTNRLIELEHGYLEVLPMPTEHHQQLVLALYRLIYAFLVAQGVGGVLLVAPLRLRLGPNHYREPDLLYLRDEHDPRRQNDSWQGADLVIEVVSPGNAHLDRTTKRREYAQAGIPEYWLVEPQQSTIQVLTLQQGEYTEHGRFTPGMQVTSRLLPGLALPVAEVFATS